MEAVIQEIIGQVPALGVLCFIVYVFLNHINARGETIKMMHDEHLEARENSRKALDRNSEVLEKLLEKISRR